MHVQSRLAPKLCPSGTGNYPGREERRQQGRMKRGREGQRERREKETFLYISFHFHLSSPLFPHSLLFPHPFIYLQLSSLHSFPSPSILPHLSSYIAVMHTGRHTLLNQGSSNSGERRERERGESIEERESRERKERQREEREYNRRGGWKEEREGGREEGEER